MKFFKPTMVALALVTAMGCQQEAKEETKTEATAQAQTPAFETEEQKQAYALGATFGTFVQRNIEQQEKLGITLDANIIRQGLLNQLDNKVAFEQEEIQALMGNLESTLREKQQEFMAKQQEEAQKAAEEALAEGEQYLAENGKKEGVVTTESGLQYEVLTAGNDQKPAATDQVRVHYRGTFIDGTEFDSSYKRNQPAEFPLNGVIAGWTEGLQLMGVGAKYRFAIPGDIAYGPNGRPPSIPGNKTLIFEVELLDILAPTEGEAGHEGHGH
ncbi:FKBP-type peptidyl-prolyl cis-trans isomerase [Thalassotalea marina]|uniref:Peptidyl-prolyl cis-trans isomerase n=1 Tax=Thalassotalea marina TaxID=1673741 RepID=A0A919ENB7_9GAMM|nr:FKBP-type peptidyl-prolyl cis-trans isomerase [Thalassotalea marina]GHG04030.1 peptidyl-prolyl cis-trans isomerase [Thalassotalea marina]